jgi:cell wall-associated NlpC family hydrolase
MWAWAQAGVSLPHYSRAQYASLPHVPLDQLQPGDLVFMGNPIHHVGMYIGNGQLVAADSPRLGIRIDPLRDIVGAARP